MMPTFEEELAAARRVEAREALVKAILQTLTTVRVKYMEWQLPRPTVRKTVVLESKQHGSLTLVSDEEARGLYIVENGELGAPVGPYGFSLRGFDLDKEDGFDGRRAARAHVRKALKKYA